MEALSQLWRVLVILFQGVKSLWKKYWTYRARKAQQRQLDTNNQKPAPKDDEPHSPESQEPLSQAHEKLLKDVDEAAPDVKRQIEIPLIEEIGDPEIAELQRGQWYGPGQAIQIQDILVADGLVYVGQVSPEQQDNEDFAPYLINPDLKIQTVSINRRQAVCEADWDDDGMLSYATLSPEMRGVFLGWLATGRKEREIPTSALLLFLFGIEHRIIELLHGERTLDELLALILELERLDVHYAHHQAVGPKIQGLIECCQVQLALSCQPETLLALLPIGQKLSTALKVALGRCIEGEKTIPMTLLWAWYQSSTVAVDLKTPAKRCESAFNFLIQTRGEQRGFSIVTGENPVMLPVVYEPFSPAFGEEPTPISVIDTVDISGFETQLTVLESLIEDCTNDLDAYSRLIGRSPEAEGTPLAVALLPQELVQLAGNDAVQSLQQWLNETVGSNDWVMVDGAELLTYWPTATPDKIRKKEAELLGQLMAKLGFGYGPDVRYGHATFNPKHSVVLFRLSVPGVEPISDHYPMALMALELRPFMDDVDLEAMEEEMIQFMASQFELTSSERSRLAAFEQWRIERPLTWKQVLGRVKKLSPEQQEKLAIALDKALQTSWRLDDARYIELQGLIPLPPIELDSPPSLGTDHELTVDSVDSPAALEPSEQEEEIDTETDPFVEVEVPEISEPDPPIFVLDTQLIAQRSQESQVASGLLSDIFIEEEPQSSLPSPDVIEETPSPIEAQNTTLSLGLDEFHWHLLNHLGQKESWARSELEAIAQDQGLLLDGALENINDVAFDHCDEALTEGEDPIEVNDWVFDELKAA